MSERALRVVLALLCVAGAAVSGYLLSVRWSSAELFCATGGCETVQSSSYAEVLGVPVAAAGLAGYLLLGATAFSPAPFARALGAALALAALAFSGYLLVIQLAVIGETCDWCLASDAIISIATAVALLRCARSESAEADSDRAKTPEGAVSRPDQPSDQPELSSKPVARA